MPDERLFKTDMTALEKGVGPSGIACNVGDGARGAALENRCDMSTAAPFVENWRTIRGSETAPQNREHRNARLPLQSFAATHSRIDASRDAQNRAQ